MPRCDTCTHFRRTRPLSALLEIEAGELTREVIDALQRISDEEGEQLKQESTQKVDLMSRDISVWPTRPIMSDCCGEHEAIDRYEIWELKDGYDDCPGYTPAEPPRVTCGECAHAITGTGEIARLSAIAVAGEARMHRTLPGTFEGTPGGTDPQGFEQAQESAAESRKALEVRQAWRNRGRLLKRPQFLHHCTAYSTPDTFAVCQVFNQLANCPKFTASSPRTSPPISQTSDSTHAPAPLRPPAQAVLAGPVDTANCGQFSISLYTAQLIVSMLGTAGAIGGEYNVPSIPIQLWTRLIGRDGQPLPVIVFREHGTMTVQAGNVGSISEPAISPTR